MEDHPFQQLPVQYVVDGTEPILAAPDHPVAHGLPGEGNPHPLEFLLLPVQRQHHTELLGHEMGQQFRRSKAAGDDRRLLLCLYNGNLNALISASGAGICVVPVLPHVEPLGLSHQCPLDFLADALHIGAAVRALNIIRPVLHHLYRHALRQLVQREFLLLPGVGPDLLLLDFLRQNEFGFVKEQGKLLLQLLPGQLLRGRPELLLLGQSDLLQFSSSSIRACISLIFILTEYHKSAENASIHAAWRAFRFVILLRLFRVGPAWKSDLSIRSRHLFVPGRRGNEKQRTFPSK